MLHKSRVLSKHSIVARVWALMTAPKGGEVEEKGRILEREERIKNEEK